MCLEKSSETLDQLFVYSGIYVVYKVSLSADLADLFRGTHCTSVCAMQYNEWSASDNRNFWPANGLPVYTVQCTYTQHT